MGCCESENRDPEIERANSMNELIKVIEKKIHTFKKEKDEIKAYLNDPVNNKITSIEFGSLNTEDLEKRVPYLDKLSDGFQECIKRMKSCPNLPLDATKEHMQKIFRNYFVSYDSAEMFRNDIADFIKLCFSLEQNQKLKKINGT